MLQKHIMEKKGLNHRHKRGVDSHEMNQKKGNVMKKSIAFAMCAVLLITGCGTYAGPGASLWIHSEKIQIAR